MSQGELYAVATFYNQFKFNPPGRHQIWVCLGTACHVKGYEVILETVISLYWDENSPEFPCGERLACIDICPVGAITCKVRPSCQDMKRPD